MFRYKAIFYNNTKLFSFTIFFVLFISVCMLLNALKLITYANCYDPSLSWSVLKSPFCSIIFPEDMSDKNKSKYKDIAIQVAQIVDELCPKIASQLGEYSLTDKKFTIILEDFHDFAYGFASTIPHPVIRINLTAPGYNIFETKFNSWLKILIAHEYTHLLHFEMTDNITTFMRLFLGRIISPNALQPLWSIEGLAIYNESNFSNGGRLWDSRYEMYLRTDFLENKLKNFNQIENDYMVSWPGGNTPYIYGQSLVHFIVSEYGEEKLVNISKNFSSFPLLGIDWSLKKILGIDMIELFQKWSNEKNKYFEQQLKEIVNYSDITQSKQITNHKYWVCNPVWLDGKDKNNFILSYKVFIPNLYPTIRQYELNSKNEKILIKRTYGQDSSYCYSPDKQYLLYSKLTRYNQYYNYYDLFLYNLDIDKQYKITKEMRIKDPAWHPCPDRNLVTAVINDAGTNNLVLFSLDDLFKIENGLHIDEYESISSSNFIYLTDFEEGTQISQPVWSPQGNKIAFSLWHKGYQDIYILTIGNNNLIQSIKPITLDHHTDINPNWSSDGKYLFFSSDRSGIFNLYAYSLNDDQCYRLTNVTTGAFEPAISPDGKELAFIQYHSSGYELHLTKVEQLLWRLIDKPAPDLSTDYLIIKNDILYFLESSKKHDEEHDLLNTSNNTSISFPNYTFSKYSPWDSIMPTYWIPYVNIRGKNIYLGFSTIAQDHLKYYDMSAILAHSIFNNSIFYDFQLSNYRFKPDLYFSWQGESSSFSEFQLGLRFSENGYTSTQDSGRFFSQNINLGIQSKYIFTSPGSGINFYNGDMPVVNSLTLQYEYDDTEKYPGSITREIGNIFSFNYQYIFPSSSNNNLCFHKILFDGRKYFPLSLNNEVIAFKLVAGFISNEIGNDLKFKLGGNSSSDNLSSIKTDNFFLRGFPDSSFVGNHLLLTSLEYRFPVKLIENKIGFKWASIFLEQISGKLFLDMGNAWDKTILPDIKDINIAIGAELDFKFKQRYSDQLIISLGIGKAINEPLPSRFYSRIGFSF